MQTLKRAVWTATIALTLTACSDPICSGGLVLVDGTCVPPRDAGQDAATGGSVDGAVDASDGGACGVCTGQKPVCLEDAGMCVQCLDDDQCTEAAAPRCDSTTHTCVPCEGNADCAGIAGKGVCDTEAKPHACVECTAADESACGGKACNVLTSACSEVDKGSADVCGTCTGDSQCSNWDQSGNATRCVPVAFQGTLRGYACLFVKATLPSMSCVGPYSEPKQNTSLGGEQDTYCYFLEGLTTCEAILDFKEDCESDDDCGAVGLDDGLCRDDGAGKLCTYGCGGTVDCGPASECDTNGVPRYCCTNNCS